MENGSTFRERAAVLPERIGKLIIGFRESYIHALKEADLDSKEYETLFDTYLTLVQSQLKAPFAFQPYHQKIRYPFDHYMFGINFMRPLVNEAESSLRGENEIQEVIDHLSRGDNVIFLANHQTEADPHAIAILFHKKYPQLAEKMIFVAGERVITDPLAVPFSMGCDLLCIYSKRYIDHPSEYKTAKQLHNKRTMQLMSDLLSEGGKCIYVAPSGGRDRMNAQGVVEIAPFDARSIEMLYLMAKKALRPTLFYPMALATYALLPPPETIQVELGEARMIRRTSIHLAVGAKIAMDNFPGSDQSNKRVRRELRADYIWQQVYNDYRKLGV